MPRNAGEGRRPAEDDRSPLGDRFAPHLESQRFRTETLPRESAGVLSGLNRRHQEASLGIGRRDRTASVPLGDRIETAPVVPLAFAEDNFDAADRLAPVRYHTASRP